MNTAGLAEQIRAEKQKCGALILAHTYQPPEVLDIADITGDSYALSVAATGTPNTKVILCGVRFMAETVKILSPEKEVILAAASAGCPMAEQIDPERVVRFKRENPGVPVVAYVNTSARLKAVCDVCVTSSTAVKIVASLPEKDILFIPDKNLGAYVQSKLPGKNMILWEGCCPVHNGVTAAAFFEAKAARPGAKTAVHPECPPEVLEHADMIGSTKDIVEFCMNEPGAVIVGTERGVVDYLKLKHPEKELYQMSPEQLVCPDMKKTTLQDIRDCLAGTGGEIIEIDEETRLAAKRAVDNMIRLGG